MAGLANQFVNPPEDPYGGTYVSATAFDLLLVEFVPTAYRIAADLAAKEEAWLATKRRAANPQKRRGTLSGGAAATATAEVVVASAGKTAMATGTTQAKPGSNAAKPGSGAPAGADGEEAAFAGLGIGHIGGTAPGMDEEELRETVFYRLEGIGYRVGLGIAERFSRDRPRFQDALEVMKFVCKEVWLVVFRKSIDNLKTNHRGIYVLTDNNFKPLKNMSMERGRDPNVMMAQAQPFLFFPAGLIRGALASLNVTATVVAESAELPGVTFQIRTAGWKT